MVGEDIISKKKLHTIVRIKSNIFKKSRVKYLSKDSRHKKEEAKFKKRITTVAAEQFSRFLIFCGNKNGALGRLFLC